MADYYVYALRVSQEESPFYIGKGRGSRCLDHLKPSDPSGNTHKKNKIAKAKREGREILVEFLIEGVDEELSLRYEVWAIKMYGRSDKGEGPLTNKTDGGEGASGRLVSEETKRLMSLSNRGSEESVRRAISEGLKENWSSGRRTPSPPFSEMARVKISEVLKGRARSESSKKANSIASSKNYKMLNPEGMIVEIQNMKKFCEGNGLDSNSMSMLNTGKLKQYRGWKKYGNQ